MSTEDAGVPTLESMRADLRAAQREAVQLREDLERTERDRASVIARANLSLARAGEETERLREELESVYATLGRAHLERLRTEERR